MTLINQNSNSNSNSLILQKSNSNSNSNSSIIRERIQIQNSKFKFNPTLPYSSQPQVYARDPSRQHSRSHRSHSHRRASFEKNLRKIQRWSPRGHILKSLALASKVKSLASKPQVLENCPVLGSRTALFFEQLKFRWKTSETSRKICEHFFCFPHLKHRRSQGEGQQGVRSLPN